MIITWNTNTITDQLQQCYFAVNDPYQDGFTQWHCKKDLLRVKLALDNMLERCPTFVGEEEWLLEQEQEKMWKVLKS
jgi:vancomycin permeability regulator SanA